MSAANKEETAGGMDAEFVMVKTRLPSVPLPANTERVEICTERLILRPFRADDLQSLHVLRTQPEVMVWTGAGRPDVDLAETKTKLDLFLPPNDTKTFNCAICWRETGEFIGAGGSHRRDGNFGWPELGYMLRKEFWGRGLATELVRGFLEAYAHLPRSEVQLRVDARSIVPTGKPDEAKEILVAVVEASNGRSHGVMRKCGLERFAEFTEPDLRDPSKTVELAGYRCSIPQ